MTDTSGEGRTASAPAFSIAVPGDWIIVDVELARDVEVVQEIIDRRVEQGVIGPDSRDAAVSLVTRIASQAADDGVRFGAVLVVEEASGTVIATVTVRSIVFEYPERERGSWAGDATDNGAELAPSSDTYGRGKARHAETTQVALPVGPAIRTERVVSVAVSDAIEQEVYTVQYVVPVDDDGNALVIVGMSPAIRRKADLDAIFVEIAQTLEIKTAFFAS